MNQKFSVAMSVYKNDIPEHFERALESITSQQTILPDEIVLVVDGPISFELNRVIEIYSLRYSMFKVIRLKENCGLGNALKVAVENCSNELIARMDSDDISVPTRFEQQLHYFSKNESIDVLGGNIAEFIGTEDNIVAYRDVPLDDCEIREYLKKRCPLNHVSVMFRKDAVQKAGGYIELHWNEDYYLWIRMVEQNCVMANTGTVLVKVRIGADMYKRRAGKRYFQSEKYLQDYMLKKKMICYGDYVSNVLKRWIVQCVLPNSIRGFVFRKLARKGA